VQFDTGVACTYLLNMRIHPWVAQESIIQSIPDSLPNTGWMNHCQVCDGGCEAIPILDSVDVEKVYSYSASFHHYLQWHVLSHGWCYVSFG
jgi:hypothetical protein